MGILNSEKKQKKKAIETQKKVRDELAKYRKNFETLWKECEEIYFDKIWKISDGYRPFENDVFPIIEGEVAILTDSIPGSTVSINQPDKAEQGKILNKSIQHVYKSQSFAMMYPELVRFSLISAPTYVHVYYDANANNGDGEIKFEPLKWRQVYLEGKSTLIDDCEKAVIDLYRSKNCLKMQYMKYADKIDSLKATGKESDYDSDAAEEYDSGGGYSQKEPPKQYFDDDTLKLTKTFIKSYDMVKIPKEQTIEELQEEAVSFDKQRSPDLNKWQDHKAHIEKHLSDIQTILAEYGVQSKDELEMLAMQDPEAGQEISDVIFNISIVEMHIEEHKELLKENPNGQMLKYKNGLREIHTINDKLVVYDGDSKSDHGQIPLAPFYGNRNGTIYGDGDVRRLMDPQRMKAIVQYKEYKQMCRVTNKSVLIDEESGITEDSWTNEDGQVFVLPQGTGVRYLDPGQASSELPRFSGSKLDSMRSISGMVEATQGEIPHPNASGYAINKIQQQAISRLRLKDRQYQYYSIKRLGFLTCSEIIQHWTSEKVIEIADGAEGQEEVIYNPLDMVDLEWNVELDTNSMAGIDREAYMTLLDQYVQRGNITFDQMLEVAPFPAAEKLREMRQENNEVEAAMQEKDAQLEQLAAELEQTRIENIRIKGEADPELLNNEERQIFEEIQREERIQALQGLTGEQP